MDGAGLVDVCTRAVEIWVDFCNGYTQAVVDSIRTSDGICIADGTTRTEIVTVVIDKMGTSATLQKENAHDAFRTLLREKYPCQ